MRARVGSQVGLINLLDQEAVMGAYRLADVTRKAAELAQDTLDSTVKSQSAALGKNLGNKALQLVAAEVWTQRDYNGSISVFKDLEVELGRVTLLKVEGFLTGLDLFDTEEVLGSQKEEWHADIEPGLIISPINQSEDGWHRKIVPLQHGEVDTFYYLNVYRSV